MIAAVYAACTLMTMLFLGNLAWGPVQFRVSEALCALALFTPAAVPGLTLGCALANVANIALSGTGALGLLDVVFGSAATCAGALVTWKLRRHPALALLGPVVANAVIVPAYLPLLLTAMKAWVRSFAYQAPVPVWIFAVSFLAVAAVTVLTVTLQSWKAASSNPVDSLHDE